MNKLLATLLAGLFASTTFAASHVGAPMAGSTTPAPVEAMKSADPKAQAAAQSKVDARTQTGSKSAMQPEAMTSGSDKAQAVADNKTATKKHKKHKKHHKASASTNQQMKSDAAKL